ncbi:MAG: hypothetical protein NTY03_02690 [Candidatus Bathyarchaeota archaeon]|nr:hypothetical protein [Candidatus Bathyarchaeota archaeon]
MPVKTKIINLGNLRPRENVMGDKMKYNCRAFRNSIEDWDDPKKLERIDFTVEAKTLNEAKNKASHEAFAFDMQSAKKIIQKIEIEVDGEWHLIE